MRRMLIPLAGFVLINVLGCHLVQGKCDCDGSPSGHGCASCSGQTLPAAPALMPHHTETIKEMPRVTPDK